MRASELGSELDGPVPQEVVGSRERSAGVRGGDEHFKLERGGEAHERGPRRRGIAASWLLESNTFRTHLYPRLRGASNANARFEKFSHLMSVPPFRETIHMRQGK